MSNDWGSNQLGNTGFDFKSLIAKSLSAKGTPLISLNEFQKLIELLKKESLRIASIETFVIKKCSRKLNLDYTFSGIPNDSASKEWDIRVLESYDLAIKLTELLTEKSEKFGFIVWADEISDYYNDN